MKPNRRSLLLSAAAALGAPRVVLGQSGSTPTGNPNAKKLIVVFAEGGWDVTACMDPKLSCDCDIQGPEVDEDRNIADDVEAVRTFGEIPIVVNDYKRPAVSAFFDRWHGRTHIVNGIWTGSIAHDPCRYRILTGTPDGTRADLPTIVGFTHGGARPLGAIDLSGWSLSGPLAASTGRIGFNSQITTLLDGGKPYSVPSDSPFSTYPLFEMNPDDEAGVEDFLRRRADRFRGRFEDGAGNDHTVDNFVVSLDRSIRFRDATRVTQGEDSIFSGLGVGGRPGFVEQLGIATDLLEAGLCHTVMVDSREDWDTHDTNSFQHTWYERLFVGLDDLMSELDSRNLMDDVVVAVISEMTRTPQLNASGGKDHWGHTSAMLLGAVRGNAVSGGTDGLLESQTVDLETGQVSEQGELNKYDNFVAGLLEMLDVDPSDWLPADVQPFRAAHL